MIELEEMRKLQLEILLDVIAFCEREKIRYSLCGGSLLGAIRHKGFIPWDDDIDISMPREDYKQFIKTYKHPYYKALCWETNHNFICTYTKISDSRTVLIENVDFGVEVGVNIDIFPVDGLPEGKAEYTKVVKKSQLLWRLVSCLSIKDLSQRKPMKRLVMRSIKWFCHLFHLQHALMDYTIRYAQRYSFDTSMKVAILVWGYGMKEVMPKEVFSHYQLGTFEGHSVTILKYYDEYLSRIYGDYMEFPPKEEQVYKHNIVANWKSKN